ncbi:hypothetical protein [Brevundimonas vesicularis]|uniref:hypothetical protein n=1 Tax=Brevundimonas vesicularis TaxID=41276 RepID=UPI000AB1E235|nr:hypothetical protein [Brevundimonas vesicularis]
MAKINIQWARSDLISVSDEARDLGFDLRKFDRQDDEVQASVRKASIDRVMQKVREAWDEAQEERKPKRFSEVRNGVYVISIGDGFGVSYAKGVSEVMYIGRGVFSNRIRSHLHNWIFDMSRSLRDVSFRFYMGAIGDGRNVDAFKDFEHFLLDEFRAKFGEKPLVNKYAGREGHIDHQYNGEWNAPLDNRGKRYLWSIRPTERNAWFKYYEDE